MSDLLFVATCETCHQRGSLALFVSHDAFGVVPAVLCVACAQAAGLPRWFDERPAKAIQRTA